MKICPNCNCENEDKSKFCKKCGILLYKMYLRGTMVGDVRVGHRGWDNKITCKI